MKLALGICLMAELPCCYKRKNMLLRLGFITCCDGALIRITSFTTCKLFDYSLISLCSAFCHLRHCHSWIDTIDEADPEEQVSWFQITFVESLVIFKWNLILFLISVFHLLKFFWIVENVHAVHLHCMQICNKLWYWNISFKCMHFAYAPNFSAHPMVCILFHCVWYTVFFCSVLFFLYICATAFMVIFSWAMLQSKSWATARSRSSDDVLRWWLHFGDWKHSPIIIKQIRTVSGTLSSLSLLCCTFFCPA